VTWMDARREAACPPVAPSPPPEPPNSPPPPPPPLPVVEKDEVTVDMIANGIGLWLQRLTPPPPSPTPAPPPANCPLISILAAGSEAAPAERKAAVTAMSAADITTKMQLKPAANSAGATTIGSFTIDIINQAKGITMPPSPPPPPPPPPFAPPPPSLPFPPSPPPALCRNTCNDLGKGRIGQCDDGATPAGIDNTIVDRCVPRIDRHAAMCERLTHADDPHPPFSATSFSLLQPQKCQVRARHRLRRLRAAFLLHQLQQRVQCPGDIFGRPSFLVP
jgi:hypothetical protein